MPERHHRELKARWWRVLDEAASPAEARAGLAAIADDYRGAATEVGLDSRLIEKAINPAFPVAA